MHLSLLSDGFLSDSLGDCIDARDIRPASPGRRHWDGMMRGLIFAASLATPFVVAFGLTAVKNGIQGSADPAIASPAPLRTASIRITR